MPVQWRMFARMEERQIRISMDGRGRWLDNVFIERLWRSLKYECVYLRAFETGSELRAGLGKWIAHYNERRPHKALAGRTPDEALARQNGGITTTGYSLFNPKNCPNGWVHPLTSPVSVFQVAMRLSESRHLLIKQPCASPTRLRAVNAVPSSHMHEKTHCVVHFRPPQ
jgi:hypothetical protein